jgi:hypothetical protein
MIPVWVGDHQEALYRFAIVDQKVAEISYTGSSVENNEFIIVQA